MTVYNIYTYNYTNFATQTPRTNWGKGSLRLSTWPIAELSTSDIMRRSRGGAGQDCEHCGKDAVMRCEDANIFTTYSSPRPLKA